MNVIFKACADAYDGIQCLRVEGNGDIEGSPFQVENFPEGDYTAWYRIDERSFDALFYKKIEPFLERNLDENRKEIIKLEQELARQREQLTG